MAKQQSFQDKATKAAQMKGAKCPVCGTIFQPVLMVSSERSRAGASWKFNERRIQVCKCNEKQVYA
ncbi:MAG TPA: hypothetical protein VEO56_03840 [Bacteroidota bacterium]|nr:hypothetical protein [Bacteroidota bacterium]HXX62907.1 hypothetical protein [Bacteroidota bacterium]